MTGDKVWIFDLTNKVPIDGFSGATPLANLTQEGTSKLASLHDMFLGFIPGSVGETSTLAILIGAAILILTGIGSWKIMLSTVFGALTIGVLCNIFAVNDYMSLPAYYHLIMGGFAFGAVFMATDPVTAPHTEKGKWIYGFLIGALVIVIRVFNPAYLNIWSSLIDYFVVQGHIKKRMKRFLIKGNA